jgi:protein-S-isoprenylcysteine O-methyltransferase Ste14
MDELLAGLGRRGISGVVWFASVIAASTAAFLLAAQLVAMVTGAPILVLHALLWAGWLAWLGFEFPRSRERVMRGGLELPFRRAFYSEILAGIACSFAQITRPGLVGAIEWDGKMPPEPLVALGLAGIVGGAWLIFRGVQLLGLAGTLFVREYSRTPPEVICTGVYGRLRHPLFVGGALLSLGSAFVLADPTAIVLGALGVLVVPIYVRLEDQRCVRIFGSRYDEYRKLVRGTPVRTERAGS